MKIEERLHDAMHEYADTIEPEPGSWTRISARFDDTLPRSPRPSRRPLVLAGVALAVVVVLIATFALRDSGEGSKVATDPNVPVAAMPSRILAVTVAGQPVVLDSKTSQRLTGFGTTGGLAEGTQIAMTPDGEAAFVVQGNGNEGCADHTIQRLSLGLGASPAVEQVAVAATSPTVSPDGQYLAFLRCRSGSSRATEIVVRLLRSGTELVTTAPPGTFFVNRLEFAADSRHVLYQLFDDAQGRDTWFELDVVNAEPPPGREVGVAGEGLGLVGPRGTTGEFLGVGGKPPSVVALHGPSPFSGPQLFALPDMPNQVVSDRSGRHLLALVGHDLYRWSVGEREPTKLVGNYIAAAWIPDPPVRPPSPMSSSMPTRVLAGIDGRITLVSAQDGHAVNEPLGEFTGPSSLSGGFDERSGAYRVFFTTTDPSAACGDQPGPGVNMITLFPGDQEPPQLGTVDKQRLVGGAETPIISPDGEFVAYGIVCDGRTLGMTRVRSGQNFRTDPLGGTTKEASAEVKSVQVLAWSPDSKRLLYRLRLGADADPHYYVGTLWPAVPQSETKVIELPSGSNVAAMALVGNDSFAFAVQKGSGTVVHVAPIRGSDVAPHAVDGLVWDKTALLVTGDGMFEVPGRITSLVADISGQHFLALTDGGSLYRWSDGDQVPTKLAHGVTAAAWLP